MRILKIICLWFCAMSLVSAARAVLHIYHAPAGSPALRDGAYGAILAILGVIFWACVFYGVQEKTPMTWKVGWFVIAVGFLDIVSAALLITLKIPAADHPWFARAVVVVLSIAAAWYWIFWWMRQKNYFVTRPSPDSRRFSAG
jgi:hypothetical protein